RSLDAPAGYPLRDGSRHGEVVGAEGGGRRHPSVPAAAWPPGLLASAAHRAAAPRRPRVADRRRDTADSEADRRALAARQGRRGAVIWTRIQHLRPAKETPRWSDHRGVVGRRDRAGRGGAAGLAIPVGWAPRWRGGGRRH